jgi:hypothetical protein
VSVKLNTRQVGDVTVVDVAGRITLGEGSSALRDALRDILHRQLGDRRAGIGFHHRHQQRRTVETAQPEQAGEGPAPDHQVVHRFRRP